MRWQRNQHRGSRPDDLGPPATKTTRHTAASYREKCRSARFTYLRRLRRMERKEMA